MTLRTNLPCNPGVWLGLKSDRCRILLAFTNYNNNTEFDKGNTFPKHLVTPETGRIYCLFLVEHCKVTGEYFDSLVWGEGVVAFSSKYLCNYFQKKEESVQWAQNVSRVKDILVWYILWLSPYIHVQAIHHQTEGKDKWSAGGCKSVHWCNSLLSDAFAESPGANSVLF